MEERGDPRIVWLRGGVASEECPVSSITPQSLYYLERFSIRQTFGIGCIDELPAKEVEALMILEAQWKAEAENGQR